MVKIAAFCVWALLTAFISWRAVTVKAPQIEEDIRARTTEVIAPQNAKIGVEVDGRFVTLRGMAADEPAKANHLSTADGVYGALGPTDALWVPAAQTAAYYLSAVKKSDGSVTLSGLLPSAAARDQLSASAVEYFKNSVANKITVADAEGTAAFAVPEGAIQALSALDAGSLLVAPDGVTLSGATASSQVAAASMGLESRTDAPWRVFVSAPAPSQSSAASLQVAKTPDGAIEARGVVATEEAKAELLNALSNGRTKVIDLLSVQPAGLPGDWDKRSLLGAAAMAKLDWAVLSIDPAASSIRGAAAEDVVDPVRESLGEGWTAALAPISAKAKGEAPKPDETKIKAAAEKLAAVTGDLTAAIVARDAATERAGALETKIAELQAQLAASAAPAAAAPAPAPAAAAKDCKQEIDALMSGNAIVFETGSAELAASSISLIDSLAAAAKPCVGSDNLSLVIGGHTDNVGRPVKNLELSRLRAAAVQAAFVERGLPSEAMSAKGYGEMKPVADNRSDKGRQANRRISFDWNSKQ